MVIRQKIGEFGFRSLLRIPNIAKSVLKLRIRIPDDLWKSAGSQLQIQIAFPDKIEYFLKLLDNFNLTSVHFWYISSSFSVMWFKVSIYSQGDGSDGRFCAKRVYFSFVFLLKLGNVPTHFDAWKYGMVIRFLVSYKILFNSL